MNHSKNFEYCSNLKCEKFFECERGLRPVNFDLSLVKFTGFVPTQIPRGFRCVGFLPIKVTYGRRQ